MKGKYSSFKTFRLIYHAIEGIRIHITLEELSKQLTGKLYTQQSILTIFPHLYPILDILLEVNINERQVLPFVEIRTGRCWILEMGVWQFMSFQSRPDTHHWGLKPRVCSNLTVHATKFVCERLPTIRNMTCFLGSFACGDNTCILSVYVCDNIRDCLNGEDEAKCSPVIYTTDTVFDVQLDPAPMLPCVNNYSAAKYQRLYVPVDSLCDGQHACDIINEDLCNVTYNVIQQIQISHYKYSQTILTDSTELHRILQRCT